MVQHVGLVLFTLPAVASVSLHALPCVDLGRDSTLQQPIASPATHHRPQNNSTSAHLEGLESRGRGVSG